MGQLTPEEREAIMKDMRSFFESDTDDEILSENRLRLLGKMMG